MTGEEATDVTESTMTAARDLLTTSRYSRPYLARSSLTMTPAEPIPVKYVK